MTPLKSVSIFCRISVLVVYTFLLTFSYLSSITFAEGETVENSPPLCDRSDPKAACKPKWGAGFIVVDNDDESSNAPGSADEVNNTDDASSSSSTAQKHFELANDSTDSDDGACAIYYIKSKELRFGRGVFAGRSFSAGDKLESGPSIDVRRSYLQGWRLVDAVYESSLEDHDMISFGIASILSHNLHNINSEFDTFEDDAVSFDVTGKMTSSKLFRDYSVRESFSLQPGDEIFTSYGASDDWIKDRGIVPFENGDNTQQSMDFLEKHGACISDVEVSTSDVPLAGRGLFAQRSFQKGDLIYVSPVFAVPRKEVIANNDAIMNYAFAHPESDVALIPVGLASMINHQPEDKANAEVQWHDWIDATIGREERSNIRSVWKHNESTLDLGFRATRAIEMGEEIFISYGAEWQSKWSSHLEKLLHKIANEANQNNSREEIINMHPFREFIVPPEGLYPDSWFAEDHQCIGKNLCVDPLRHYTSCEMYLAPSKLPGAGRGIFAGMDLSSGSFLEESPSLNISNRFLQNWSLNDYVYQGVAGHSIHSFGAMCIFNHNKLALKNVERREYTHQYAVDPTNSFDVTTHYAMDTTNKAKISAGDELFTMYSDDESWFSGRGIDFKSADNKESLAQPLEFLQTHGQCISDVYTNKSQLLLAGRGLFARRHFKAGDIVHVTPVALLPKREVIADDGVILNFCIANNESDIAVFPIGLGSLANHQGNGLANMKIDWFDWESKQSSNIFGGAAETTRRRENLESVLKVGSYCPLDLAYIAVKDIKAGEELTFDYGEDWQVAWSDHIDLVFQTLDPHQDADKPIFRHFISPPEDLFPTIWNTVDCYGRNCGDDNEKE